MIVLSDTKILYLMQRLVEKKIDPRRVELFLLLLMLIFVSSIYTKYKIN